MRVCIDVVRSTVRRPSGVTDTNPAAWQRLLGQQLFEIAEFAGFLGHIQRLVGHNGNARRVVAAVLQTAQTLDHDVHRGLPPDISDVSAHRRNCTFPALRRWAVSDSSARLLAPLARIAL